MKRFAIPLVATASAIALAACAPMNDNMGAQTSSSARASASTSTDMDDDMAMANGSVMVGGAAMLPSRTIVQNASAASNLTTLVQAVQAAGLVETLSGPGPFTVFAPTNDAFARLPQGTVSALLEPARRAQLQQVLTFHVVPGNLDAAALMQRIRAGNGTATINSVEGSPLRLTMENGAVAITDEQGTKSFVTQADVRQSNGVVHVINGVLIPRPDAS